MVKFFWILLFSSSIVIPIGCMHNGIIKSSTRINNLTINSNYCEITITHQKIRKIIKINGKQYNYDALLQKGKDRTVFWDSKTHGLFNEQGHRIKTVQEEMSPPGHYVVYLIIVENVGNECSS